MVGRLLMLVGDAAASHFALNSDGNRTILDSDKATAIKNLKGIYSLRKASDFILLNQQARIFKNSDFLIRYLDNHRGHARLGMAISKKRVKHAVKRNRIKRIIRETFRKYRLRLPNRDYMVSYRGTQEAIDALMLHKKLSFFWERQAMRCRK